jgi:hypothetical protein
MNAVALLRGFHEAIASLLTLMKDRCRRKTTAAKIETVGALKLRPVVAISRVWRTLAGVESGRSMI